MGARGPAPTPTAVLKLRGSWLAKDRTGEPEPSHDRPRCPAWLDSCAKNLWRRLIPQLEAMGVLGTCDRNAVARYCLTFSKWRRAETFLMKHGDTATVRGELKPYPQVKMAMALADQLLKLEREFGLTPSARARLAKPKDNPNENRGKSRFIKDARSA